MTTVATSHTHSPAIDLTETARKVLLAEKVLLLEPTLASMPTCHSRFIRLGRLVHLNYLNYIYSPWDSRLIFFSYEIDCLAFLFLGRGLPYSPSCLVLIFLLTALLPSHP